MKRAIALILSLIMALSLVACGTPAAPDNTNTSDSEENNDPYTIAVVVKITGIAWYERMQVGIDKFNADTGNDAYITGASTADAAEQVAVIEDLIAQGVDALVVIPNSAEAVESVLAKAREQGIVVICHEGSDVQNADYDLEAFNNTAYGEFLMETLAGLMGAKGTFTNYVGYLTSTSHNEWTDAEAALQAEKYPDMTLVSPKNETSEDSDTAYTKTKELLKAYPNLTGFLGSAMADVPGVARAWKRPVWKTAPMWSAPAWSLLPSSFWRMAPSMSSPSGILLMPAMLSVSWPQKFLTARPFPAAFLLPPTAIRI